VTPAAALAGLSAALAVLGLGLATAGERVEGRWVRALGRAGARLQATPPRDLEARVAAAGGPAGLGPRELMAQSWAPPPARSRRGRCWPGRSPRGWG